MSVSAAYIVGPLVGGKLADPSLASCFGYATPFWAVFGLLAGTVLATLIFFAETRPREARRRVSYFEAFTNLAGVFKTGACGISTWLISALSCDLRLLPLLPDVPGRRVSIGCSKVSEFIAWVGVPIVLANLWLTGALSRHFPARELTICSGVLTGAFMMLVVVPRAQGTAWVTLFLTSLALAICLPSCATLLSILAGESEQGRVMGNNQALQVGAEALSGLIGGVLAALAVKLSLLVLGAVAIGGGLLLLFGAVVNAG
jgi:predicted MFS family arabinose efflux permease